MLPSLPPAFSSVVRDTEGSRWTSAAPPPWTPAHNHTGRQCCGAEAAQKWTDYATLHMLGIQVGITYNKSCLPCDCWYPSAGRWAPGSAARHIPGICYVTRKNVKIQLL